MVFLSADDVDTTGIKRFAHIATSTPKDSSTILSRIDARDLIPALSYARPITILVDWTSFASSVQSVSILTSELADRPDIYVHIFCSRHWYFSTDRKFSKFARTILVNRGAARNGSYNLPPVPGSEEDWMLAVRQFEASSPAYAVTDASGAHTAFDIPYEEEEDWANEVYDLMTK